MLLAAISYQNVGLLQLLYITQYYYLSIFAVYPCRTIDFDIELFSMGLGHIPIGSLVVFPMRQKKSKLVTKNSERGYRFPVLLQHLLTVYSTNRSTS